MRGVLVTAVRFNPESAKVLLAYAAHPSLGLVQSMDGGLTWTSLGMFLGREDAVSHIAFHRARATIYVATFGSDVYRSDDGADSGSQSSRAAGRSRAGKSSPERKLPLGTTSQTSKNARLGAGS